MAYGYGIPQSDLEEILQEIERRRVLESYGQGQDIDMESVLAAIKAQEEGRRADDPTPMDNLRGWGNLPKTPSAKNQLLIWGCETTSVDVPEEPSVRDGESDSADNMNALPGQFRFLQALYNSAYPLETLRGQRDLNRASMDRYATDRTKEEALKAGGGVPGAKKPSSGRDPNKMYLERGSMGWSSGKAPEGQSPKSAAAVMRNLINSRGPSPSDIMAAQMIAENERNVKHQDRMDNLLRTKRTFGPNGVSVGIDPNMAAVFSQLQAGDINRLTSEAEASLVPARAEALLAQAYQARRYGDAAQDGGRGGRNGVLSILDTMIGAECFRRKRHLQHFRRLKAGTHKCLRQCLHRRLMLDFRDKEDQAPMTWFGELTFK